MLHSTTHECACHIIRVFRSFRDINQRSKNAQICSTLYSTMALVLLRRRSVDLLLLYKHKRSMTAAASIWPKSKVIYSDGDYVKEAFLEDPDLPLYQHQTKLPLLPVPNIEDTIARFLPTALPLAENENEISSLHQACLAFPSQAQHLQERLLARASIRTDTSWLSSWWNTLGYLQVRDPNIVHVSYFFQLKDDPTLGQQDRQIRRGASLLRAAFEYRTRVVSGQLAQDAQGQRQRTPLCSTAYKYMFHASRIPKQIQDSYRIYDPSKYTHAVVVVAGQFFKVPLTNLEGDVLSLYEMEKSLQECVDRVSWKYHEAPLDLGWLSTMNRNDWAEARHALLQIGGQPMAGGLELLESGMLLLCLDDDDAWTPQECGLKYWHGGQSSGGNRWADKSIQLICTKNGKVGFVGEHSMMDGMPAVGFCNYLQEETYEKQLFQDQGGMAFTEVKNIFEDAFSVLIPEDREKLQQHINKAKADFTKLTSEYEMDVQSFRGYGSLWMKKAGYSPDAYVQMAIQLATYRLFGSQQATYESTQVRPFLHGRTETTRAVSPASQAFVKAMGLRSGSGDGSDKKHLLEQAVQSHANYSRTAGQGQGVDRQFFGLSMLVKDGEDLPELFNHPLFQRSKRWRVSTSTLPNMPGFGPVVPDGVGVAYEVRPDSCAFTVSGRTEFAWTNRLCHLLEESLLEMEGLVGEVENAHR
jgi:carnitine O-acetyltransferase